MLDVCMLVVTIKSIMLRVIMLNVVLIAQVSVFKGSLTFVSKAIIVFLYPTLRERF